MYKYALTKGRKKHINFFDINFLAPTQDHPILGPLEKFIFLISWQRTQNGDPHKLFLGDFWGSKGGPKRAIFGHKKFILLFFFSCPYLHRLSRENITCITVIINFWVRWYLYE